MIEKSLVCFYGVPWLYHFLPPIGNGKGCKRCRLTFRKTPGRIVRADRS
jgi:hypothetical protein